MSNYIQYFKEAYKKLLLEGRDYDISKEALDGIEDWKNADTEHGLSSLEDVDSDVEVLQVTDPEAYIEDDVEDDYVGQVVLECVSCHSKITLPESQVYEDEETGTCSPDVICPICNSDQGYTVVGKIEHFDPVEEDEEEKLDFPEEPEVEEEEEEVEEVKESLHDRIRRKHLQEAKELKSFLMLIDGKLEEIEAKSTDDAYLKARRLYPSADTVDLYYKGLDPEIDKQIA